MNIPHMAKGTVIFDFDLTLVPHESLVEVLKRSLVAANDQETLAWLMAPKHHPQTSHIPSPFYRAKRVFKCLQSLRRAYIDAYVNTMKETLDPRFLDLTQQLRQQGIRCCLLSAAYLEWLIPLAQYMGISPDHVWGNRLIWVGQRALVPRPSPLLFGHKGKANLVKRLVHYQILPRPIIVVGDGKADAHIYMTKQAQAFIQATYFYDAKLSKSPAEANWVRSDDIEQLPFLLEKCLLHIR